MKSFYSLLATAFALLSVVTAEAPPEVTPAPSPRLVAELLKRQAVLGIDTCGWAEGEFIDDYSYHIFLSRGRFIGFEGLESL